MDFNHEAKKIINTHTAAFMSGCNAEYETNEAMYEAMIDECSFLLTDDLLEGKYTPLQYNAIRNELGKILWDLFGPHIEKEREA